VLGPDALVLADANYDSWRLYQAVLERGGCLLTPLKGKSAQEKHLRAMRPGRRAAVEAWRDHPFAASYVLRERIMVEQVLGTLCASSQGLSGLPGFVRRLERVRRWAGAKIIWYNAALAAKQRLSKRHAA